MSNENKILSFFAVVLGNLLTTLLHNAILYWITYLGTTSVIIAILRKIGGEYFNNFFVYLSVFCILFIPIFILYRQFVKFRPIYPKIKQIACIHKKVTVTFMVNDDGSINQEKAIEFVSIKNGVNTFPTKYYWTGDTKPTIQVKNAIDGNGVRYNFETNPNSHTFFTSGYIKSSSDFNKNAKGAFKIFFNLAKPVTYKPMLTYSVDNPINELYLRVKLACAPRGAKWEIRYNTTIDYLKHREGNQPSDFDIFGYDQDNKYFIIAKKFKKPKLFYVYGIYWDPNV